MSESEIISWLNTKAAQSGIPGLVLKIDTNGTSVPCMASCMRGYGFGATFDDAIEQLRLKLPTPQQEAQKLREEAASLNQKAEALLAQQETISTTT